MADTLSAPQFGQLLRERRRSQKMSQVELGGGRYSGSYISHLESGRRLPTPEVMEFLARRLGVSPLEWGVRKHLDKSATLRAEAELDPVSVEELLVAERAWYDRDWQSAEKHARRAAAGAEAAGDAIRHWEALYVVAQSRFANGEFEEAAQIALEISDFKACRDYPVARAQSLSLASISHRAGSRLGWAIAHGARAVEAASSAPPIILAEALMSLVSALSEAGHSREETGVYLRRLDDLAPQLSANHSRGMVHWTIGTAAYKSGDAEEGMARYERAKALLSPQRDLRLWLRFHRSDATCRLDVGITDQVAELLRVSATGLEIIGNNYDVVELRQARARLALLEGDPAKAASMIQELLADPVLGDPEYRGGMSEWILASALRELGRPAEAAEHYGVAGELLQADGRLRLALDAFRIRGELCCVRNLTEDVDNISQTVV